MVVERAFHDAVHGKSPVHRKKSGPIDAFSLIVKFFGMIKIEMGDGLQNAECNTAFKTDTIEQFPGSMKPDASSNKGGLLDTQRDQFIGKDVLQSAKGFSNVIVIGLQGRKLRRVGFS